VKIRTSVRNYYVLPCCLLLLNLCVELVSYKAKDDRRRLPAHAASWVWYFSAAPFVGFVMAPAIGLFVVWMQRSSRQNWGGLGELFFLLLLGALIFWLYYRVYIIGPESILPPNGEIPFAPLRSLSGAGITAALSPPQPHLPPVSHVYPRHAQDLALFSAHRRTPFRPVVSRTSGRAVAPKPPPPPPIPPPDRRPGF